MAVLRLMTSSNFAACYDRQVGGLLALENPAGIDAGLTKRVRNIGSVAHQTAGRCELARLIDRGHRVAKRQCARAVRAG